MTGKPEDPNLHQHYLDAVSAHRAGRLEEAESLFRQHIALRPDRPAPCYNLAIFLGECGRFQEAEEMYRQALQLRPDFAEALHNLGRLHSNQQRFLEAEECLRRTVALMPGNMNARFSLGVLLLTLGRLEEGWPLYEARYHPDSSVQRMKAPGIPEPMWQGEPLEGKSLMIWTEQGFGDEIHFCRYVPLLKERGARRVELLCKPELRGLLATLPGVDAVIAASGRVTYNTPDYWTFPLSLPLRCGTAASALPARIPYLEAPRDKVELWRERPLGEGFTVGLAWRGSSRHPNDAFRSLRGLEELAPLWSVPGVTFVNLQKDARPDEIQRIQRDQPLIDLGPSLQDFGDTAAVVTRLDLVITVDTALAHLAGALGKSSWVLLPVHDTDWRWMREREDSPWYPGVMRLFRQQVRGDWTYAVQRLTQELARRVKEDRDGTSRTDPGGRRPSG